MNRRYYVLEGPNTEAFCAEIEADREAFKDRVLALREKYKADAVFIRNQARATSLGFKEIQEAAGIRFKRGMTDGFYVAVPDRRTKIGRELAKDLKAASTREPSDMILERYKAWRHDTVRDPRSTTGMSIAISVGFPLPDWKRIVLSIPAVDDEPFTPPAEAREIKKSEYIALTEEGA